MTVPGWRNGSVVVLVLVVTFIGCARRPDATRVPSTADTATISPRSGVPVPGAERTSPPASSLRSTRSGGAVRQGVGTSEGGSGPQAGTVATTHRAASATGGVEASRGGTRGSTEQRRPLTEFTETSALEDVYFEFDRSTIPPAGIKTLDANATWIKRHPDHLILIEGHCDDRGTNDYNVALGERRARSTMNYLVAQGVPATRMIVVSYGEERPGCREPTEACWAKNRRAHFLVKSQ
jgi:peptidoglycan-associated lipoprotein